MKIMRNKKAERDIWIVILIGITFLLECTIFNFRHWESLKFKEPSQYEVELASGIEWREEGYYTIVDPEQAYIEITGIQKNIRNIYLNIVPLESIYTNLNITADDAANALGLNCGNTTVISTVQASRYIQLHLNGISNYIKIKVLHPAGFSFYMETPGLNRVRPFEISWLRMTVIFLCLLFLYTFRPKSKVYQMDINFHSKRKRLGLIFYVAIHIIVIVTISRLISPSESEAANWWPSCWQYEELADALIKGQVYLDRIPPKSLEWASNPYDPGIRWETVTNAGESFEIDYAYFHGKYYSYFGPVPAILFFIPYKLITGMTCNTWSVVTICTVLFCIVGFWFIYVLAKRYFKNVSLGLYLLMSSFYVIGSGIVYLVYLAIVYSVPIITSLLLGTLGLGFWIISVDESSSIRLKKKFLLLGAICIALVMGCRPQMAIILFFAFPIFWNQIVSERLFFSKKGISNTLCVIMPFLIIGIALMYYNYARFGSLFDFGANYNLTSNDMTHRGIIKARIPLGIFAYLFQPLSIVPQYPFMHTVHLSNDYMGFTNMEPMFGGFFMMNILSVIILFTGYLKKLLRKWHVFSMSILSIVMALIIIVVDIQMAGLTQRYMSDFGWLFAISVVLEWFALEKISKEYQIEYIFRNSIRILMFICIVLNLWNLLITERYYSLIWENPNVFYSIKHLIL